MVIPLPQASSFCNTFFVLGNRFFIIIETYARSMVIGYALVGNQEASERCYFLSYGSQVARLPPQQAMGLRELPELPGDTRYREKRDPMPKDPGTRIEVDPEVASWALAEKRRPREASAVPATRRRLSNPRETVHDAALAQQYNPPTAPMTLQRQRLAWASALARRQPHARENRILDRTPLAVDLLMAEHGT
jgi:hypothetical protein